MWDGRCDGLLVIESRGDKMTATSCVTLTELKLPNKNFRQYKNIQTRRQQTIDEIFFESNSEMARLRVVRWGRESDAGRESHALFFLFSFFYTYICRTTESVTHLAFEETRILHKIIPSFFSASPWTPRWFSLRDAMLTHTKRVD